MTTDIKCSSICKVFARGKRPGLLRDLLMFSAPAVTSFNALDNVTLSIGTGESVGIIGRNGAGKSTLLKVIAGLMRPDSGDLEVNGRIVPLLELGVGFHHELTGRENIEMNSGLLGFNRAETLERLPRIIEFSELGDAIDDLLGSYSSGMILRVAFAIAICVDPEILLIDEVLAVGDAGFQAKCLAAMTDLQRRSRTIVLVSHELSLLRRFGQRVVWMDNGQVVSDGPAEEVIAEYLGSAYPRVASGEQTKKVALKR